MTNGLSKSLSLTIPCNKYAHPWTESCYNSAAGHILHTTIYSAKLYTVVYMFNLLMRGRIPSLSDLKRTFFGIIKSTGFLVINACGYLMLVCVFRNLLGQFHYWTIAFVPAFISSFAAINCERRERRPLLALYVANLATETVWRMGVARNIVRPIPFGETLVFGISSSILLYLYKRGLHKTVCKDSLFKYVKFVVGGEEEIKINTGGDIDVNNEDVINDSRGRQNEQQTSRSFKCTNGVYQFKMISEAIKIYDKFLKLIKTMPKHKSCPHSNSCTYYSLSGGSKLFGVGIGIQVGLKLALQLKNILRLKFSFRKTLLNKEILKLGLFLGGFSFLFKASSCSFRHLFGKDDPLFALPAGLISSIAFTQYPSITIALYVMWKMLQITNNMGINTGYLPNIPGFMELLYSLSTATLFNAAALETETIRPSYWKFLSSNSGRRINYMDRRNFDFYGYNSHQQVVNVQKLTNTDNMKIEFLL